MWKAGKKAEKGQMAGGWSGDKDFEENWSLKVKEDSLRNF